MAWTIDELADRVEDALSGYSGPPSGRVRAVPDRRTIRYYTTIGLLDRPAAMDGRTALYDQRHLRQLVAIKRLQAAGKTLAEIQTALAGIPDDQLATIARLPAPAPALAPAPARRAAFWKEPPAPPAPPAPARPASARRRNAVELAPGVVVVLDGDRAPTAADLAALAAAAAPLLHEIRLRGLSGPLTTTEGESQ